MKQNLHSDKTILNVIKKSDAIYFIFRNLLVTFFKEILSTTEKGCMIHFCDFLIK